MITAYNTRRDAFQSALKLMLHIADRVWQHDKPRNYDVKADFLKAKPIKIPKGQCHFTLSDGMKGTGMSKQQVRTAIKNLIASGAVIAEDVDPGDKRYGKLVAINNQALDAMVSSTKPKASPWEGL